MKHNHSHRVSIGLAAAALTSAAVLLAGCSTTSGAMSDQIDRPATHAAAVSKAAVAQPEMADKDTNIAQTITNGTDQTLTLVSASHTGTGAHWQHQAQPTLAPNGSETVSDYSAGDNEIDVKYQDASGAIYTFETSSLAGIKDSVNGTTTSPSYRVLAGSGSGLDDHSTFAVYPGQVFNFIRKSQYYTVPAGVTALDADVIGGSGGDHDGTVNGAEIKGVLPVTPGETLMIGTGGQGSGQTYAGGWGLGWGNDNPPGNNSLSGGSGVATDVDGGGGGGGASVLIADNQLAVVAGGGGGEGNNAMHNALGGQGGYNGQLAGQNGQDGGGQAGSMPYYPGQNSAASGTAAGGAGGGGYRGGAAGSSTNNSGGGAGSSFAGGLQSYSVTPASGGAQDGSITLTGVN